MQWEYAVVVMDGDGLVTFDATGEATIGDFGLTGINAAGLAGWEAVNSMALHEDGTFNGTVVLFKRVIP
jgi:hypothetical protein